MVHAGKTQQTEPIEEISQETLDSQKKKKTPMIFPKLSFPKLKYSYNKLLNY